MQFDKKDILDMASLSVEEITLIPYGCTTLRISEFPVAGRYRVN